MINYFTNSDLIEDNAVQALASYKNQQNIADIAVFPDIHYCSEKALPVGVAFKTTDVFYPLITGKDMGCGVCYLKIDKKDYLKPFDKEKHYKAFQREHLLMTDEGLGGGNHFLSIEEDSTHLYIIVHTGSRNLGIYQYQKNFALTQHYQSEFLPIEVATEEYIMDYNRILHYAKERRIQFVSKSFDFLVKNKYVKDKANFEIADSHHNLLEFTSSGVIHRKGSTQLVKDSPIVIPLSMTRGSLIVKANIWNPSLETALYSCSHGAGRQLSRSDTSKHWYSLKEAVKNQFRKQFSELLEGNDFPRGYIQEFDFAYKPSENILIEQPYLIKITETKPVCTIKFTEI
ncbi:MAG: hypothetical protein EAZ08_11280 [Cytophagales bacterium]|nr:MAG: hypothetical protein EAZ08_11280 [Cytophagales bacterium]